MLKNIFNAIEYQSKVIRSHFLGDLPYRRKKYKKLFGRDLKINNPITLNEKINFRMIFQKNPLFTYMADKLAVRSYVSKAIGGQYLVPLLGVFEKLEYKSFDLLPESFVMKCNHDSGSTIICHDKSKMNKANIIRHFNRKLKENPYYKNREWQYKNITPKILAEEKIDVYNGKNKSTTPEMFRFHCFHGAPYIVEVDFTDETGEEFVNVYDVNWELQPFTISFKNTSYPIEKPMLFEKMINLSEILSTDFDYCRIDLMLAEDRIYFSEITFTPESGQLKISPLEWDAHLGKKWIL